MKNYKEISRKAFDKQAPIYDISNYSRHARELYPHMLQSIIHVYGRDVLDLGCGSGALMKQVYDEDHTRCMTGVDLSQNMLDIAQTKFVNAKQFIQCDASKLPFDDESFDLVYCNDSFHHYPNPEVVVKEVYRVLREGGIFFIGDISINGLLRLFTNLCLPLSKEGDVHMYSKKEFINLMSKEFHDVTFTRVETHACIVKGVK